MTLRTLPFSLLLLLALAVTLVAPRAWSLPTAGALRPAARVVDADGNVLDLRAINGKPILVLYEDKGSTDMNAALKAELSRLAKSGRFKDAVALVPVADVESYDYWPARGFVKDAIRSESRKIGATIYCDWDGSFRAAARLRHGTSSVMLIGTDARIRFASEGPLSRAQRAELITLLRAEVERADAS